MNISTTFRICHTIKEHKTWVKSSSIHRNTLPTNAEEQLRVQKVEEGMMKLLPLVGEKTEQTLDLETSDCPNAEKCPKKFLSHSF